MDKDEEALHGWVLETGQQLCYIPGKIQWTIEIFFKKLCSFSSGKYGKILHPQNENKMIHKGNNQKILKDSLVLTVLLWK